jgi:hypothetical protein
VAVPNGLTEEDEQLHEPSDDPLWCENYMTVAYAPEHELGAYIHLCRTPAEREMWEQEFVLYLPGDRFLVANGVGRGQFVDGTLTAGNLTLRCDKPFERWTQSYVGGARLVTGEELRSGPLQDGPHVPVEFHMEVRGWGPAFLYETMAGQTWGHGHYDHHHEVSGTLVYGTEQVEFAGSGLRDHSWGPRDYTLLGDHLWIHGQFPDSGRTFMIAHVEGVNGAAPFTYAVLGDRNGTELVSAKGPLPLARSVEEAERAGYVLEFATSSGPAVITAEILAPMRMAFRGRNGISMGFHRAPGINHDYIEAHSRFEWDGEVGYGLTERSIQLFGTATGKAAE